MKRNSQGIAGRLLRAYSVELQHVRPSFFTPKYPYLRYDD